MVSVPPTAPPAFRTYRRFRSTVTLIGRSPPRGLPVDKGQAARPHTEDRDFVAPGVDDEEPPVPCAESEGALVPQSVPGSQAACGEGAARNEKSMRGPVEHDHLVPCVVVRHRVDGVDVVAGIAGRRGPRKRNSK